MRKRERPEKPESIERPGYYQPTSDNTTTPPSRGRNLPTYRNPPPPPKKIKPEFQTMYDLLVDAEKWEAKDRMLIAKRVLVILKENIDDFITAADVN